MEPQDAGSPTITPVAGIKLDLIRRGSGKPILFLHPGAGIEQNQPFIELLAKQGELFAPAHPGFGVSERPAEMSTVDDLAYYYLDFLTALDLRDVTLVGVAMGGWIAAEIAIKSTSRIARLVLADTLGIKVSGRETRDIADVFALTDDQISDLTYHDPAPFKRDLTQLPDDTLRAIARNREASARYGWSPYMHNPKLKQRLHRIDVPTLVLWGESDRIVKPDYGRAFAALVPGARFETMPKAGHLPHIEQPEAFVNKVAGFMAEPAQKAPSQEVA